MAAYFVDIDGTITVHGTNDLLPGVLKTLQRWSQEGHQIILVTQRGREWSSSSKYGLTMLNELTQILEKNGVKIFFVITDVLSPRTMVNDAGAYAMIKIPVDDG